MGGIKTATSLRTWKREGGTERKKERRDKERKEEK